jgi:hypothetical protein
MTDPHDIALISVEPAISMIGDGNPGQYGASLQLERMIGCVIIHAANSIFGVQNKGLEIVNLQKKWIYVQD